MCNRVTLFIDIFNKRNLKCLCIASTLSIHLLHKVGCKNKIYLEIICGNVNDLTFA